MLDLDICADYSPDVQLRLEAQGSSWPIAKLGPDYFVPVKGFELNPCDARIVMSVDGEENTWLVRIVHGVCPIDDEVSIKFHCSVK